MDHDAVGALAIICIFGAPVAAFVIMRVLAHRERIEMIRRGMVPPTGWSARRWTNVNAGVPYDNPVPGAAPRWSPGPQDTDSPDRSLRKGIMTSLVGLAILIGLSFFGYYPEGGPFNSPTIHPGPWLLGGLIPMFVGIAQIIVALLSGARIAPVSSAPNYPPQAPFGAPPPAAGAPDARIYEPEPRTHSGYEELTRPVPPPDRR
ncbi:MAG: hypothetical protein NVSMB64_00720 [Candidatus Velthaea sp.]